MNGKSGMRVETDGERLRLYVGEERTWKQHCFLRELKAKLFCMFEGWEGNVLVYNTTFFSLVTTARHLEKIQRLATVYGFEVSEEAKLFIERVTAQAKNQRKEKIIGGA